MISDTVRALPSERRLEISDLKVSFSCWFLVGLVLALRFSRLVSMSASFSRISSFVKSTVAKSKVLSRMVCRAVLFVNFLVMVSIPFWFLRVFLLFLYLYYIMGEANCQVKILFNKLLIPSQD